MSEWKVEKIMKKMAKKKSKGKDGISQECLLLGQEALAAPITAIINQSIESGVSQPAEDGTKCPSAPF